MADSNAPRGLGVVPARWRQEVLAGVRWTATERQVIDRAAEALDRAIKARAQIGRDGMTVPNRFGTPTAHPLLHVESANRAAFTRACRELGLLSVDDLAGLTDTERANRLHEARSFAASRRPGRGAGS